MALSDLEPGQALGLQPIGTTSNELMNPFHRLIGISEALACCNQLVSKSSYFELRMDVCGVGASGNLVGRSRRLRLANFLNSA